jgi:hypothetical protein
MPLPAWRLSTAADRREHPHAKFEKHHTRERLRLCEIAQISPFRDCADQYLINEIDLNQVDIERINPHRRKPIACFRLIGI